LIKQALIRFTVICFWTAAIVGLLYWPEIRFMEEKSINIFAWGDILDPAAITDFEKETGIKVHLSYYASNEEMIVKLKATGGEGYDLIIPSDYSVGILREEGLLKEIDRNALNFYSQLNPVLMNHPFDPGNKYSIPFEWELFVLGIDKTYFESRPFDPSWDMVFQPQGYRISMTNDPVQALCLAAFNLYGPIERLSKQQLQETINLLSAQKKWVTAYADFRADYFLASRNCPVVVSSSSYIWRTMHRFPYVGYVIPKEGTFVTIENICIPEKSKKEKLAYQFINFLYKPERMAEHYETLGVFPATLDSIGLIHADAQTEELLHAGPEVFKKFHFTRMVASQKEIRDAWVQSKG